MERYLFAQPGAIGVAWGGGGNRPWKNRTVLFWVMKSKTGLWWWLHSSVYLLKIPELHTQKRWILWDINGTSIRVKKKNKENPFRFPVSYQSRPSVLRISPPSSLSPQGRSSLHVSHSQLVAGLWIEAGSSPCFWACCPRLFLLRCLPEKHLVSPLKTQLEHLGKERASLGAALHHSGPCAVI